jgi:hypothetical protein
MSTSVTLDLVPDSKPGSTTVRRKDQLLYQRVVRPSSAYCCRQGIAVDLFAADPGSALGVRLLVTLRDDFLYFAGAPRMARGAFLERGGRWWGACVIVLSLRHAAEGWGHTQEAAFYLRRASV